MGIQSPLLSSPFLSFRVIVEYPPVICNHFLPSYLAWTSFLFYVINFMEIIFLLNPFYQKT